MFRTRPRPYPISSFDSNDHVALIHARADPDIASIAPSVTDNREPQRREFADPYHALPRPSIRVYSWKEQDSLDPDTIVIISVPIVPSVKSVETAQARG